MIRASSLRLSYWQDRAPPPACFIQVNQDYASELTALRHGPDARLVGLTDCYVRTKTRALVLKYALANPDSQRGPSERPQGTVGGMGQFCVVNLVRQLGLLRCCCRRVE